MNAQVLQPVQPGVSSRVLERLNSLGMAVVVLSSQGGAEAAEVAACPWPERLVLSTPAFAAAVRQAWPALGAAAGQPVQIWPGVWLAPLPAQRRRRASAPQRFEQQVAGVLMLGAEFLESEQLHQVCHANRVDYLATVARFEPARLVSFAEAQRLAAALTWMQQDSLEIDRRTTELQTMSQQLGESYEELSLLYKLSANMTVDQQPVHFLNEACRELQQVVGLRWMALLLTDQEPCLNELAGQIFTAGPVEGDVAQLQQVGRQVMALQPPSLTPLVVDDTTRLGIAQLPHLARQLLVVWLMKEDKPLGILFGGDKLTGDHISSVDSKLCNSLANSMSIFLENMMLYEDVQAMFLGTLHALTNSIDAKDRYTHGHSERVALMSRQLARAAGLDDHLVERVYVAGLVHDVGKIGVPESVLCKPGRLTPEEFGLIKLHPEIGAHILQDIRQMKDLIPGVLHHHERWDGKGYPHGLVKEEIPLFGRLICLADAFDAMSSSRTYRRALRHEQVMEEIQRCAATQFDPQLAALFVRLDFEGFYDLIHKHKAGDPSAARSASA